MRPGPRVGRWHPVPQPVRGLAAPGRHLPVRVRSRSRHRRHTRTRHAATTLAGMLVVDCDGIDVALVPWPDERSLAEGLARDARPRVLLVEATADAPDVRDPLEDWARVPVDHGD